MKKLTQRGDTIVEVLISMLVVSVILGGAFVTTNKSQTGVRDSQEHTEALKLMESQLEELRSNAGSASPNVFPPTQPMNTPFCMYNGVAVAASGSTAVDCTQNSSGDPTTTQPAYNLSISSTASNGGYLYTVNASWYDIDGNGKANESMVYRLYP